MQKSRFLDKELKIGFISNGGSAIMIPIKEIAMARAKKLSEISSDYSFSEELKYGLNNHEECFYWMRDHLSRGEIPHSSIGVIGPKTVNNIWSEISEAKEYFLIR